MAEQDWFTANAPKAAPASAPSGDWFAQHAPADFRTANEKDAAGEAVVDPNTIGTTLRHWWSMVNPVQIGQLLPLPKAVGGSGVDNPLNPQTMVASMHAIKQAGDDLWSKGDHVGATAKYVESVIPVLGPLLSNMGDEAQRGRWAALLGDTLGLATTAGAPAVLDRLPSGARAAAPASSLTGPEAATNAFAAAQDIPLDAATATGNRFVRGVQKVAGESMLGSPAAERAQTAQAAALTQTGRDLAAMTSPRMALPETGGTAVQTALQRVLAQHDATATAAYQRAEQLLGQQPSQARSVAPGAPFQAMGGAPVDVRAVKSAVQPLYQTLQREAQLVPLQGGKARALVAIDRLMQGPDFAPLLDAERASSDFGSLAGTPDVMRTPGQAAAAQAFGQLRQAVDTAAAKASPDILKALQAGRAATKAKYGVADLVDALREEPVQAYRQLTAPKDTNIALLRQVQQTAPTALPDVARGYLEDALGQATERGRFDHADRLYANWQRLGPETKTLLFPDADLRTSLDNFFLLAKRIGENPNPSGTAGTAIKTGEVLTPLYALMSGNLPAAAGSVGASVGLGGLSRLLYSPAGAKALTKLLSASFTPGASTARVLKTMAWAEVANAARAAGLPITLPAAAQATTPSGTGQ